MSLVRVTLLWALAVAAMLLVGCGGGGGGSEPNPAQQRVESAGFDGVESGQLSLELQITSKPAEKVLMRISGPFEQEKEGIPQFDFAIEAGGKLGGRPVEFFGGISMLTEASVVNYESTLYQSDPVTHKSVSSALDQSQGDGGAGDLGACPGAAASIGVADLVENFSTEAGKTEPEEPPVTWIAGDLNVAAAIDALTELAQDPGCGAQLDAFAPQLVEQLAENKEELEKATSRAQVRFAIDAKGVVHDLSLQWFLRPQEPGGKEMEIDFEMKLTQVNELEGFPHIVGTESLGALLKKFGLDSQAAEDASGEEIVLSVLAVLGQQFTGRGGT